MRQAEKRTVILAIATAIVIVCAQGAFAQSFDDFYDIRGHWSEDMMKRAYEDGYLTGYDGGLRPDGAITMAEVLTVLCRVTGATELADPSGLGLTGDEWYYETVLKARASNMISSVPDNITKPMTRADAFNLTAKVFGLTGETPRLTLLDRYTDAAKLSEDQRWGMAALVNLGYVRGNNWRLGVSDPVSRAEFVAVLYRIIDGANTKSDIYGDGIANASVEMEAAAKLAAGGKTIVTAFYSNEYNDKLCTVSWYIDGELRDSYAANLGTYNVFWINYTYPYEKINEAAETTISFVAAHNNADGSQQEIRGDVTVQLQQYSQAEITKLRANDVLAKVTHQYAGDYTLEWAQNNDYTGQEKEIWVNAKGYTSKTKYLLWINQTYQRVNVLVGTGAAGQWTLDRSFIVATGAGSTPTPTGVYATTYKNSAGWVFGNYRCYPCYGWWEGSNYAFHSRLYSLDSSGYYDDRIGFPLSAGCIRMYDEDIQWLYDNVPSGTTVVSH